MKLNKEAFFDELRKGKTQNKIAREQGLNNTPGHWNKWRREFNRKYPEHAQSIGDKGVPSTSEVDTRKLKGEHDQEIYFSAAKIIDGELKVMPIEEYCEHYGLDHESVVSYKLIKHNGGAYYNIGFAEKQKPQNHAPDSRGIEQTKQVLRDWITQDKISNLQPTTYSNAFGDIVIVLSDLHLGALVTGLQKTSDFSKKICMDYLMKAAQEVNNLAYDNAHVHILGDLVETVSGLNHINSWQSIGSGDYGANIIRQATEIIHECFLSKIPGLKSVKMVSGNHDRLSAQKDVDPEYGGASLVAWGLGLIGYNVEYHPICVRHEVDGICYILLHGDRGISKKQTKEIVWDYGKQGVFNVVLEGHLHSRMERTVNKKLPDLKHLEHSDTVDTRRFVCPSFFTGNLYSESNGWTSTPGFKIIRSNGKGKPNVFDYTL